DLGAHAGDLLYDRGERLDELAAFREEGLAADDPVDRVVEAVPLEEIAHALLQALGRALGGEAEIEIDLHGAGNDVLRAGAGVDVGDLERGRREERVARIPRRLRELVDRGRDEVHRV